MGSQRVEHDRVRAQTHTHAHLKNQPRDQSTMVLRWDPALRKLSWGQREFLHCQGQLCSPSKTTMVPASRSLIHKRRMCTMGAAGQLLSCWLSPEFLGESGCIKKKLFIFGGAGSWLVVAFL